jgi:hypothetical protein
MQNGLEINLMVPLTQSQYEVLKTVANASGDTIADYLHSAVIDGIEADIELYFGVSKSIKEKLYKQLEDQ